VGGSTEANGGCAGRPPDVCNLQGWQRKAQVERRKSKGAKGRKSKGARRKAQVEGRKSKGAKSKAQGAMGRSALARGSLQLRTEPKPRRLLQRLTTHAIPLI